MATAAERQRAYRERQKAKLAEAERIRKGAIITAIIPPTPDDDPTPPGGGAGGLRATLIRYTVVEAVEREVVALGSAAIERHGDVAAALQLAEVLDNPQAITSHAAVARQLKVILDDLRQLRPAAANPLAQFRQRRAA